MNGNVQGSEDDWKTTSGSSREGYVSSNFHFKMVLTWVEHMCRRRSTDFNLPHVYENQNKKKSASQLILYNVRCCATHDQLAKWHFFFISMCLQEREWFSYQERSMNGRDAPLSLSRCTANKYIFVCVDTVGNANSIRKTKQNKKKNRTRRWEKQWCRIELPLCECENEINERSCRCACL